MKHQTGEAGARPAIAVHADGKKYPALLVELCEARAKMRLLRQQCVQPGALVSLSVSGLPTFPGDVVDVDGETLIVEFRSALHPTVVQFIEEEAPAAVEETTGRCDTQLKRATVRPPFPFDK